MKKLTKEEAIKAVANIDLIKGDDERAHSAEDDLRAWYIECCASDLYNHKEVVEIAGIIKQTENIDFERHCA